jgi:membrane protein YdbS with pleckstrin-like domain
MVCEVPMASDLAHSPVLTVQRPSPSLLTYYFFQSFLWGPLFFILLIVQYLRYRTLRYAFDQTGVTVQWGSWSHHEITVAYTRIQDIHLRSNVIERWLRLARIEVQTASGNADVEITLEGIHEYVAVRDFLYAKIHDLAQEMPLYTAPQAISGGATTPEGDMHRGSDQAIIQVLHDVAHELHGIRILIEQQMQQKQDNPSDGI